MITIDEPAVEALIQQRLIDGGFANVEAVLTQALSDAPLPRKTAAKIFTTEDMLAAFQRSPSKNVDLAPEGVACPISDSVEL